MQISNMCRFMSTLNVEKTNVPTVLYSCMIYKVYIGRNVIYCYLFIGNRIQNDRLRHSETKHNDT